MKFTLFGFQRHLYETISEQRGLHHSTTTALRPLEIIPPYKSTDDWPGGRVARARDEPSLHCISLFGRSVLLFSVVGRRGDKQKSGFGKLGGENWQWNGVGGLPDHDATPRRDCLSGVNTTHSWSNVFIDTHSSALY